MRVPEIVLVRALVLACALTLLGPTACKPDDEAAAEPASARAGQPVREARPTEPTPKPSEPIPDPERVDKLADLDAMCKALDHDYVDGTLTDYYRDIQPRTTWGKALRDAGNESIQPGRLLEKAVAELSPDANDPALGNCRTLLDYLDDVE